MATISSSQKPVSPPAIAPSSAKNASPEEPGLFASLFGGVMIEGAQTDSPSQAENQADDIQNGVALSGDETGGKHQDAAGIIMIESAPTEMTEEDETQTALLAGLGAAAVIVQNPEAVEANENTAENSDADIRPDAQIAMPSLLAEMQKKESLKTEQKTDGQPKSAKLPAEQLKQLPDEQVKKISEKTAPVKPVLKSAVTDTASQTNTATAGTNQQPSDRAGHDGQILQQASKLAQVSAGKTANDTSQIQMVKKDGHVTPKTAIKADAGSIEAGDLKSAKLQSLGTEQMSRLLPAMKAGEGLERAGETAPKAGPSEAASSPIVSANSSTSGGQSSQHGPQSQAQQTLAGSSMSDTIADMLDMMEDNWAETLVKRIERALGQKAEGIDFELNPRNLGRLRVNLNLVNDQTHIHMKAETASAAQMIGDAESRLAQMFEQSGMKLAQFSSQTGLGDQPANGGSQKQHEQHKQVAQSDGAEIEDDNGTEQYYGSENKVNLKA